MRSLDSLELNKDVTEAKLNKSELQMAKRLVEDMTADWEPDEYRDTFQEQIMALVETKASEGKIVDVETNAGDEEQRKTADIIDLTELLKRSLGSKKSQTVTEKPKSAAKPKAKKSVEAERVKKQHSK